MMIPFVPVDFALLIWSRSQATRVVLVVRPENVIDARHALPCRDPGVRIFNAGHSSIGIDLGVHLALHAIVGVAEVPELDLVRQTQNLKCHGDLDWIWAGGMGVECEWFDVRHT